MPGGSHGNRRWPEGVPRIGAILLPSSIGLTPEEPTCILNDAAPRLLCFDPEFIPVTEALRRLAPSVEFVDALPKGGTGKILKEVLREKY
jgi:acyl-CoA synthetase (AMP-forming)/AMP-acid ligase II